MPKKRCPSNTLPEPDGDASTRFAAGEESRSAVAARFRAMRRSVQPASKRSRSRRKTADAPSPTPSAPPAAVPRNVGSVEALLSLTVGVLMVVVALVPRTFRQLFLLAFGGALVHRGMTGRCGVYEAAGIDTARNP